MAKPIFTISEVQALTDQVFRLVQFEIPGGITTPAEFAQAVTEVEAQLTGKLPILVNGRGPVWGYGMVFHAAHPTPAIATYDPRLGYVVVQTHDQRFSLGQVLELPGEAV
jgi:CRISPR-associated protein Csx3